METSQRPVWSARAWAPPATVAGALILGLFAFGAGAPATVLTAVVAFFIVAGVLIWAIRRTRSQRHDFEERLTVWAAERATQAERLRIARDLHDLASHGIGLITVRAASARATSTDDPVELTATLTDIENVSRETTTELRRMLTVLREPDQKSEPARLRPAETLSDLSGIVRNASAAGLDVTLHQSEVDRVSLGAQLTACTVVREALHNTLRHAGPTRAEVTIRCERDTLVVSVRDDGPRPGWRSRPGSGHGLLGLRERLTALDGSLTARADGNGFLVRAQIPDGPVA